MKKIIVVNASPRKGGNSDVVANKLAAEIKDAEVKVINLNEFKLNPCQACDVCKTKDKAACVQQDDMGKLIPEIDACDGIVLISPVYFSQINGPAKTYIDRHYCFFNPTKPGATVTVNTNKKVAVVLCCGAGPVDEYKKVAEAAGGCFRSSGAAEIRVSVCGGVNAPGACKDNADFMKEVSEIAAWL